MKRLVVIVMIVLALAVPLSAHAYEAWDWQGSASPVPGALAEIARDLLAVVEAATAANAAHPDFLADLRRTAHRMLELAAQGADDPALQPPGLADSTASLDRVADIPAIAVGSPVGHWILDDAARGTALDRSPYGHHGTVSGPHPSTDPYGREGSAYYFSGTARPDHHIDMGNSPAFTGLERFSVAAWIRPMRLDSRWRSIISKHSAHGDGEWYVAVNTSGFRFAHIDGNGVRRNRQFNYEIPIEEWIHVAVTFDDGAVTFYVNGVVLDTAETGQGTNTTDWPLLIGTVGGASFGQNHNYWGCIYDVRLYDYAVSPGDVLSMIPFR